jgi:hypothetical protein
MGYDLAASLSGSSSATSGLTQDFRGVFGGDFVVGRGASGGLPNWVWLAALGVTALGLTLWLIRR